MNTIIKYIILSLLFTGATLKAKEGYFDKNLGLNFPAKLGSLEFIGQHTYESPSLGYSIRYQDNSLFKIDIYVYDKNLKNIGSGINSKVVKDEFLSTLNLFPTMEKMGHYKEIKVISKGEKKIDGVSFLWAQYKYKHTQTDQAIYTGQRVSDTYIISMNNFFIKVRLTLKKEDTEKKKSIKDDFLKALAQLLKKSMQRD